LATKNKIVWAMEMDTCEVIKELREKTISCLLSNY
jgi:hypothetical protein